jgi:hypothetical protein
MNRAEIRLNKQEKASEKRRLVNISWRAFMQHEMKRAQRLKTKAGL